MMPGGFWPDELSVKQVETERLRRDKKSIRNEVIEECARVAAEYKFLDPVFDDPALMIAAAIRALKDKPTAP